MYVLLTHSEVFKFMHSVREFALEKIRIQDKKYFMQPCLSHAFWITSSSYRVLGRCPGWQARGMSWYRTSWRAFSRSCSELSVWCQTFTRVPIESNFYNTCPMDMKFNQSGQDMSLPVVIKFRGNPGSNKKLLSNSPFWYFCH